MYNKYPYMACSTLIIDCKQHFQTCAVVYFIAVKLNHYKQLKFTTNNCAKKKKGWMLKEREQREGKGKKDEPKTRVCIDVLFIVYPA